MIELTNIVRRENMINIKMNYLNRGNDMYIIPFIITNWSMYKLIKIMNH